MIVVNSQNTTHTISLVARYKTVTGISFFIKKEGFGTSDKTELVAIHTFTNGYLSVMFDYNFNNKFTYEIEIKDNNTTIYKGRIKAN